jgi:O-antigen/teichoic acid export membrane protein
MGELSKKTISTSVAGQLMAELLKILSALLIGAWIARYLGPGNLGLLSYVASLVGMISPVTDLGIKANIPVFLSEGYETDSLIGTSLFLRVAGALLVPIIVLPIISLSHNNTLYTLALIALLSNLIGTCDVLDGYYLAIGNGIYLARISIIQTIVSFISSGALILARLPLIVFAGLPLLANLVRLITTMSYLTKSRSIFSLPKRTTARQLMVRGLPLMLASITISIYMKCDILLLQWLQGPEAVGQYSVAVKVVESVNFVPVIIATTILPYLSSAQDEALREQRTSKFYAIMWFFGIAATLACMFLFPIFTRILFGSKYYQASIAVGVLAPSIFAIAMGCASSCWLQLNNREWVSTIRTAVGALINICLNLMLIPKYGIIGAAAATSISYTVATFGYIAYGHVYKKNAILAVYPPGKRAFIRSLFDV